MERIQLTRHGRTTIVLPSRGSAGYRWNFTVDNPHFVQVERAPSLPEALGPMPGRSRDERFFLIAQKPGETTVRFSQTRSFGPANPPIATHEVHVVILDK